jgi:hypothetical protein
MVRGFEKRCQSGETASGCRELDARYGCCTAVSTMRLKAGAPQAASSE